MTRHLLITLAIAPIVLALMLAETVCDWAVWVWLSVRTGWNGEEPTDGM